MYSRVIILVEGQTEERFVKTILEPYLLSKMVHPVVTILNTKTVKDGVNFKGGVTSYQQVKHDLSNLFRDTNAKAVTTMFDYYALPTDFPGYGKQAGDCYEKVGFLEDTFARSVGEKTFLPYLQLHEFEALLFSSVDAIADTMPNGATRKTELDAIRQAYATPEEINNSPETCPSKRLMKLFPEYTKVVYGTLISGNIGLDTIRRECPHFNEWLTSIESLAPRA